MIALDHIAVIAPDLAAGVAWVRDALGVEPPVGGAHPLMGTHNHLLRLGDDLFLEVIAADPAAPAPTRPRWFGLDDRATLLRHWAEGRRLRGMVARTDRLDEALSVAPGVLGSSVTVTRGDRTWTFGVPANGALPFDGAAPSIMDWGARGPAGPHMVDRGCRLVGLVLETPDPDAATALHGALRFVGRPEVRPGPATRLLAMIETPHGVRLLT